MWHGICFKEWSEGFVENALKFQCTAFEVEQNKICVSRLVWRHQGRNRFYEKNEEGDDKQTENDLQ